MHLTNTIVLKYGLYSSTPIASLALPKYNVVFEESDYICIRLFRIANRITCTLLKSGKPLMQFLSYSSNSGHRRQLGCTYWQRSKVLRLTLPHYLCCPCCLPFFPLELITAVKWNCWEQRSQDDNSKRLDENMLLAFNYNPHGHVLFDLRAICWRILSVHSYLVPSRSVHIGLRVFFLYEALYLFIGLVKNSFLWIGQDKHIALLTTVFTLFLLPAQCKQGWFCGKLFSVT